MDSKAMLKIIVPASALILGIWLGGWFFSMSGNLKDISSQPIGDIFNSVNALFAGLAFGGVIVTIYVQIRELKDSREELAKAADANLKSSQATELFAAETYNSAVLDLYQNYCSAYFQTVKTASHRVLINCVQSPDYCRFVVSRLFVVDQIELTPAVADQVAAAYPEWTNGQFASFAALERADRFKLDELLNFFTLLAARSSRADITRSCDFFYAWWRPLFWLIAVLQQERYAASPIIQEYSRPAPLLPQAVRDLDALYGYAPFASREELMGYIERHPKIRTYLAH